VISCVIETSAGSHGGGSALTAATGFDIR